MEQKEEKVVSLQGMPEAGSSQAHTPTSTPGQDDLSQFDLPLFSTCTSMPYIKEAIQLATATGAEKAEAEEKKEGEAAGTSAQLAESSETAEEDSDVWGSHVITYNSSVKREMDEVLEFIKKNGDCASGRWELLSCGCRAFLIDWSKPADRIGLTRIPSLYSPCCDLVMIRVELSEFVGPDGKPAEALVQRHALDCPLYQKCIEHLY
jgi:hypothetical protein